LPTRIRRHVATIHSPKSLFFHFSSPCVRKTSLYSALILRSVVQNRHDRSQGESLFQGRTIMSLFSWLRNRTLTRTPKAPKARRHALRRVRPQLEALEDRVVLSTFYAATASNLIADINAANKAGGANTIVLTAPTTSPYFASGLSVANKDYLTIIGNGDTIDANHWGRLFDVASGASLTLQNMTLQNGLAYGSGGAIYNQGTLVLSGVGVYGNSAVGSSGGTVTKKNQTPPAGQDAAGGAIWSNGSLTVENQSVIRGNSATGGAGGYSYTTQQYGPGGNAFGGGIYIAGGTANITGSSIGNYYPNAGGGIGNTAQGGDGSLPGSAYGGGLYVAAGTVTLSNGTLEANRALAGTELPNGVFTSADGYGGGLYVAGGTVTLTNNSIDQNLAGKPTSNGQGGIVYLERYGGGIFIASGATVYLDSFTVTNTVNNLGAYSTGTNIYGTYTLLA
jgi:hypothetical protein